MTNQEKIKLLRRKYISANVNLDNIYNAIRAKQNVPLELIEETVADVDTMGALFPMQFEDKYGATGEPAVYINMRDPEDEPTQMSGANRVLADSFARTTIEDIKFNALNIVLAYEQDKAIVEKYKPLFLQQAAWCFNHLSEKPTLSEWEQDKLVLYANQLAYYTYFGEQQTDKLHQALEVLQVAYGYADWHRHGYIKHTYVDVLLKLGSIEEAYAVITEGLEYNEKFELFQEYKNDEQFIKWLQESDNEKAVAMRRRQQAKQELLDAIIAEEKHIRHSFKNPLHPLVVQHAENLIAIKQYILSLRQRALAKTSLNKLEEYKKNYILSTATVQELDEFEATYSVSLPDEYKAYLLEIGTGGVYFMEGDVPGIQELGEEEISRLKKPFPITSDKIHEVQNYYGVKAWVYSDSNSWIENGVLPEGTDMQALFGLPEESRLNDGCISLGYSSGRNELVLIANGEFANEVWSDRLGYGAAMRGCFGAASAERLTLLPFIAASLRVKVEKQEDDNGDWL
ncbi:SMI1/KNR4 family protein [Chitinophaga agri]|uniref:SMI1/KNR4 family protein n=1 Tax=Chitinophaga agri TaxID=2703787 RepID=A0A6B9ZAP8_9BACT|nr:SMI1/KNR4 family protein [Chitinophaga agri]QHS59227.1 SMI1/KNR4 family protein [Chitinophaga agri]